MSETENNELTAGKQSKEPRSNQKLKLLYLAKILLNNTDANHDITLDEILNKLHAYDVTAARKSLYDDIVKGGNLTFVMGNTPNKEFGAAPENRPKTAE